MHTNKLNTSFDRPLALVATIWLGIVGSFVLLILPVFVGALITHLGYSRAQAGWIGSADLIGFSLASVAAFMSVRRISWRLITVLGLVMIVAGDAASSVTSSFVPLLLLRLFLSGFGAGLVISVAYTLLGDSRRPERNTAIYFSFNVLAGALALYILPSAIDAAGTQGLFVILALTGVSGLPFAWFWLPRAHSSRDAGPAVPARPSAPILSVLSGIALFNFGLGGTWAFLEQIGLDTGLSVAEVSLALSATYLVSMLGSATAAWQDVRFGYLGPYAAGIVTLGSALFILMAGPGATLFVLALVLINFGWNYSMPYQFSAVYRFDESGRMTTLIILVQSLGLMLAPGFAGTIAETAGYGAALLLQVIACLGSLALFVVAHRLARLRPGLPA